MGLARLPSPVTINEAWSYSLTQVSVMKKIITVVLLLVSLAAAAPPNLKGHLLAEEVLARDNEGPTQCIQEGVTSCRRVRVDFDRLKTLKRGDRLALLPGHGVTLELQRDPEETASGGISLSFSIGDGGEANVVVSKSGAMYGSIRPLSGDVIFAIEACKGEGCIVLLERPSDYFNDFKD